MTCKVCENEKDECICPECPTCGDTGEPRCYKDHVLRLNVSQLINRAVAHIERMREEIAVEEQYIEWLKDQGPDYCEPWNDEKARL